MTHTSTEQPEALRLAECLEKHVWQATPLRLSKVVELSADELRRLHARVQELEAAQAQRAPLTDEQIEAAFKAAGGRWADDSYWLIEDADLHPFVRSITQEKQG